MIVRDEAQFLIIISFIEFFGHERVKLLFRRYELISRQVLM